MGKIVTAMRPPHSACGPGRDVVQHGPNKRKRPGETPARWADVYMILGGMRGEKRRAKRLKPILDLKSGHSGKFTRVICDERQITF